MIEPFHVVSNVVCKSRATFWADSDVTVVARLWCIYHLTPQEPDFPNGFVDWFFANTVEFRATPSMQEGV